VCISRSIKLTNPPSETLQIVFGDETASFTLVTRVREREGAHSATAAPRVDGDAGAEAARKALVAVTDVEKRKREAKVLEAMDTGNPLGRKQLGKATMAWLATGAAEVGSSEHLSHSLEGGQQAGRGYHYPSGFVPSQSKLSS
jgi:hypothetical protein